MEFDLTQLDSSDDQCNLADAGRKVMPRLGDRDDNSSTVLAHNFGQEEFIPVPEGRRSCQKAVHSASTSGHSNRYAPLMDDGSQRGLRRLVLINGGGTSMPDNTQDDWDSSEEPVDEEVTHAEVEDRTTNVEEDQSLFGLSLFIIKTFNQKPLSSKTTFIKNHFHQKPLSSKTTFIKNHFHPNHFYQKRFSSKTIFIKNHFHQNPISKILDPKP